MRGNNQQINLKKNRFGPIEMIVPCLRLHLWKRSGPQVLLEGSGLGFQISSSGSRVLVPES